MSRVVNTTHLCIQWLCRVLKMSEYALMSLNIPNHDCITKNIAEDASSSYIFYNISVSGIKYEKVLNMPCHIIIVLFL